MGIGVSIVIFAIGAILTFGVTVAAQGVNLDAIGVILMVVGMVGLLVSALFWASWAPFNRTRTVVDRYPDHDHTHDHTVERYREVS
jgi:uncharacterized protein DUF6458